MGPGAASQLPLNLLSPPGKAPMFLELLAKLLGFMSKIKYNLGSPQNISILKSGYIGHINF